MCLFHATPSDDIVNDLSASKLSCLIAYRRSVLAYVSLSTLVSSVVTASKGPAHCVISD